MLGAIAGDIIGSVYEANGTKNKHFQPLFAPQSTFTDDTVLTVAVADTLLTQGNYTETLQNYTRRYPKRGYGGNFSRWAASNHPKPYNSWGNGSAMRVSPVAYGFDTLAEVLAEAKRSAEVTHNHREGIKGAQATAAAIFFCRQGKAKPEIRDYIETTFHYNLQQTLDEIRPQYSFDLSCQGSVPQAIISFLESVDFEDTIRNAISLGGDSDTIACIAGGMAEAFYGKVPDHIADQASMA
ncbi:ADP-ribosylglycohydrolase family protein [Spirulina sp. CS-785/01]|uniref:ADP-ribosylglycohydrolase family protein n=1 Tax=Spirulina sp. CS-785/01 TaxID=3021716 RepID=UPI0023304586|nr:ADP-ribosylglycohydrolase family protein [Spirulina sp. CS-785/01]MDB9314008.1 ADP-ribosylglycohydrolase family protein [Spirulina sp. CS-785/01]